MKHKPVILKTLGDLKDRKINMYVSCSNSLCTHPGANRLDDLIEMFGRDKLYRELKFRCKKCGGRSVGVLSTPC